MPTSFTAQYKAKKRAQSGETVRREPSEFTAQYKRAKQQVVTPSITTPGSVLNDDLFTTNPTQRVQTPTRELINSRQDVTRRVNAEKQREDQDNYSFKDRANDFLQGTLTSVA